MAEEETEVTVDEDVPEKFAALIARDLMVIFQKQMDLDTASALFCLGPSLHSKIHRLRLSNREMIFFFQQSLDGGFLHQLHTYWSCVTNRNM